MRCAKWRASSLSRDGLGAQVADVTKIFESPASHDRHLVALMHLGSLNGSVSYRWVHTVSFGVVFIRWLGSSQCSVHFS